MQCDDWAKLRDDGFIAIDRHLDNEAVRGLLASFETIGTDDTGTESVRLRRGAVFAMRNLLSVPFVQKFIATDGVRSPIDRIAPGSVAVRAMLFDKTGDANWTVPWHQDRSIAVRQRIDVVGFGPWSTKAGVVHVQPPLQILREMVTLRFSLDSCDAHNGPLRTIAGTHRTILDKSMVDEAVKRGPQSLCTTAAGGMVIIRPLVLHASSPAVETEHRRVLHIEFGPPNLPGGLDWAKV